MREKSETSLSRLNSADGRTARADKGKVNETRVLYRAGMVYIRKEACIVDLVNVGGAHKVHPRDIGVLEDRDEANNMRATKKRCWWVLRKSEGVHTRV